MAVLVWPLPLGALRSVGQSVMIDRGNGDPHKGVDLRADPGTPVLSATSGRVLRVEDGRKASSQSKRNAGLWIDVLGEDGRVYRYLHLREAHVVRGARVEAGTPLGSVAPAGTSGVGRDTAPHLHFEIRAGDTDPKRPKWHGAPGSLGDYGDPLDPLQLLPRRDAVAPARVPSASASPAPNAPDAAAVARAFGSRSESSRPSWAGRLAVGALVVAVAARALRARPRPAVPGGTP